MLGVGSVINFTAPNVTSEIPGLAELKYSFDKIDVPHNLKYVYCETFLKRFPRD